MLSRQKHLTECGQSGEDVIRRMIEPVLGALVQCAQEQGDLREDVVATDLGVLLISAVGTVEFTAPADADVWHRYLCVVLDGLRARPAGANTPLTHPPLDDEQIELCMTGWKYGTRETPRPRPRQS
jgi:hypothetical protein